MPRHTGNSFVPPHVAHQCYQAPEPGPKSSESPDCGLKTSKIMNLLDVLTHTYNPSIYAAKAEGW